MKVQATTQNPAEAGADTVVVGVFEDEGVAHDLPGGTLEAMLDTGEAQRKFKRLAVTHADGRRAILIGLGDRTEFDAERARSAAGVAHNRAVELGTDTLCWEVPHHVGDEIVAGLVEGTVLHAYRFDRYKERRRRGPTGPSSGCCSAPTTTSQSQSAWPRSSSPRRTGPAISATRRPTTCRPPRSPTTPRQPPSGSESKPRCSTRTRSVRWGWARSPRSHRARSRALG